MKSLGRLWRGELALDAAFWNWAVFGGLAFNAATSVLSLFLIATDRPVAALIAGYAFSVPYNIAVLVGVWRSAQRDKGDRQRADLMRITTLAGALLFSVT